MNKVSFWTRFVLGRSALDQVSFGSGQFRVNLGTGLGQVWVRSYDGYLQQLAYRYRLVDQGQLIDSVPILDHRVSV